MSKLKKALEKAKKDRGRDTDTFFQEDKAQRPALRLKAKKRKVERGEVQVTYFKTKVLHIDPRILKRNKVISPFQDNKMADQVKILRTQVLNRLKEIGGNSLLVTSPNPREGKTMTTINLGVSIAQELDRTVLIVDADLRRHSRQHYDFAGNFFGVNVNQGLSDYLLGQVELPDLLLNPGIQKLTMLPGGNSLPNSAELLGSARMESLIIEMKNRYSGDRIIIFDSPSVLICTDPLVLSRFIDGILLVVEAEKTSKSDLRRVMELLRHRPVIGILLNKARE